MWSYTLLIITEQISLCFPRSLTEETPFTTYCQPYGKKNLPANSTILPEDCRDRTGTVIRYSKISQNSN